MKKLNVSGKLLLAAMSLLLGACGAKDPLAGQPDYIRNATPGFQKPADPIPDDKNMIISSNQTRFFFMETIEGQGVFTGRILLDKYNGELSIENLIDFEGATFDPVTGVFTWTPPRGFVSGVDSTRDTFLRVRLIGFKEGTSVAANKTQDFPLTVKRFERVPSIEREVGLPTRAVREGENLRIVLYVKDEDAVNQDGQKPRIFIQAPVNEPRVGDLTPYIRVASEDNPEQNFSDRSTYEFTINVNLYDMDLTKNSGDYHFRVTAVSRHGKMSLPKEYKISVMTNVVHPVISSDTFEAKVGVDMVQDILVADPRQEGIVSVEILNPNALPKGFSFKCMDHDNRWMKLCRATWAMAAPPIPIRIPVPADVVPAPPAPLPGPEIGPQPEPRNFGPNFPVGTEAQVKIRTTNSSPVKNDSFSVSRTYNLKFKVVGP